MVMAASAGARLGSGARNRSPKVWSVPWITPRWIAIPTRSDITLLVTDRTE